MRTASHRPVWRLHGPSARLRIGERGLDRSAALGDAVQPRSQSALEMAPPCAPPCDESLHQQVFLREPLARLVSLFNMYPDGTWGSAPSNHSPALNFAAAYRRRLRGRNALVCYVSGATLCDSVGYLPTYALTCWRLAVLQRNYC